MKIDGIEIIRFSEWDGLPIKNHLPEELRARMKTENQWLEFGYVPKTDAMTYEMHPSVLAKKTFFYYLDKDVEAFTVESAPKNCLTCSLQIGRYCEIAGDYVSSRRCCSEWTP